MILKKKWMVCFRTVRCFEIISANINQNMQRGWLVKKVCYLNSFWLFVIKIISFFEYIVLNCILYLCQEGYKILKCSVRKIWFWSRLNGLWSSNWLSIIKFYIEFNYPSTIYQIIFILWGIWYSSKLRSSGSDIVFKTLRNKIPEIDLCGEIYSIPARRIDLVM